MTVYVDAVRDWTFVAQFRGLRHTHWCHLTADTETELHAFAGRLGLKRSWYQRKGPLDYRWHYDITPPKRARALRLGAREVDRRFVGELLTWTCPSCLQPSRTATPDRARGRPCTAAERRKERTTMSLWRDRATGSIYKVGDDYGKTVILCPAVQNPDTGEWSTRTPVGSSVPKAELEVRYEPVPYERLRDPRITRLAALVEQLLTDHEAVIGAEPAGAADLRTALDEVLALPDEWKRRSTRAAVAAGRQASRGRRGGR